MRLPRLPELDGLRALLAWWVVFYHAHGVTFSNAFLIERGPFAFLSHGSLAVDVFMILSGFVIWLLLDRERESYGVFVLRRFLRLFPIYAVCLAVMIPLQPLFIANLRAHAATIEPELFERMLFAAEQPLRDLGAQLAWHVPMLHGMVPETWLHNAAGAFLTPAWSISLEWQFYLIAPLAFALTRRGAWGMAAWGAITVVAFATRRLWPPFGFDAFLPLRLHLFTVGMASYYGLRWAFSLDPKPRWLVRAPAAAITATFAFVVLQSIRHGLANGTTPAGWFPLAIWGVVLGVLVARWAGSRSGAVDAAQRVLTWPPLVRLGAASYSTYLAHWPVLVLCQAAFRTLLRDPAPWPLLALHLAISLPIVALLSIALHRTVEQPGIALGRRLAARLRAA